MRDRTSIIAIVVGAVVVIAVVVVVVLMQNAKYGASIDKANKDINSAKTEIANLKAEKDTNNFTPSEVVVAFLNEVKGDNTTNAKLYLSSTVQSMDIKNTLKLGSDLSNINIGDNEDSVNGSDSTVDINIQVGSDTVARHFVLTKENDAWKITNITAE